MYNHYLDTFVCVADCGSFNKAADKLYISAPAVLKQVNELENHLSMQLLHRTKRGVTLTKAGTVIYNHAKLIMHASEQAIKEARNAMEVQSKVLRVGSSMLNPPRVFFEIWDKIRDVFPEYRLQVIPFHDDSKHVLEELDSIGTKFDFIVAACNSKPWLARCNFLKLGTYQHGIAVTRNHPLASRQTLSIADLSGCTVMMNKEGYSDQVDGIRHALQNIPGISIEDTNPFYDLEVFNRCNRTGAVLITLEHWKDIHPSLVTIPVDWGTDAYDLPHGILYQKEPPEDIQDIIDEIEYML